MKKMTKEEIDFFLGKHVGILATSGADGYPQATPVWVDYDMEKGQILVNTADGRVKTKNMKLGAKVAISVFDRENPYSYVSVQGEVKEVTKEGAMDHINELSVRYTGKTFISSEEEGAKRIKIGIGVTRSHSTVVL